MRHKSKLSIITSSLICLGLTATSFSGELARREALSREVIRVKEICKHQVGLELTRLDLVAILISHGEFEDAKAELVAFSAKTRNECQKGVQHLIGLF